MKSTTVDRLPAMGGKEAVMARCPNGHENVEDEHFCGECGVRLVPEVVICACGHTNPADHHFCGECGTPLAAARVVPSLTPATGHPSGDERKSVERPDKSAAEAVALAEEAKAEPAKAEALAAEAHARAQAIHTAGIGSEGQGGGSGVGGPSIPPRVAQRPNSLAELKRALQPGAVVTLTAYERHPHSDLIGVPRNVVSADAGWVELVAVYADGSHLATYLYWPSDDEVEFTEDGFIADGMTYRIDMTADEESSTAPDTAHADQDEMPTWWKSPPAPRIAHGGGDVTTPFADPPKPPPRQNPAAAPSQGTPLQQFWRRLTKKARIGIGLGAAAVLAVIVIIAVVLATSRDERSYQFGRQQSDVARIMWKTACQQSLCGVNADKKYVVTPEGSCEQMIKVALGGNRPEDQGFVMKDMMDGCLDGFLSEPVKGTGTGDRQGVG